MDILTPSRHIHRALLRAYVDGALERGERRGPLLFVGGEVRVLLSGSGGVGVLEGQVGFNRAADVG